VNGVPSLLAPNKSSSPWLADNEVLGFQNAHSFPQCPKAHAKLPVEIHLTGQRVPGLKLTLLDAIQDSITDLQIDGPHLKVVHRHTSNGSHHNVRLGQLRGSTQAYKHLVVAV